MSLIQSKSVALNLTLTITIIYIYVGMLDIDKHVGTHQPQLINFTKI